MNSANQQRAIRILEQKGYAATSTIDGKTVLVADPVQCFSASRRWVEYEEKALHVSVDLREVFRFIDDRS